MKNRMKSEIQRIKNGKIYGSVSGGTNKKFHSFLKASKEPAATA